MDGTSHRHPSPPLQVAVEMNEWCTNSIRLDWQASWLARWLACGRGQATGGYATSSNTQVREGRIDGYCIMAVWCGPQRTDEMGRTNILQTEVEESVCGPGKGNGRLANQKLKQREYIKTIVLFTGNGDES